MNASERSLQVGDPVMLRHGADLPPHYHVAPGAVGRVVFLDDDDAPAVTVRFAGSGRPVRLRPRDVMGAAESPAVQLDPEEPGAADTPIQAGDRVEILAAIAQPKGQPAAPLRYGTVLEVEDENGRVCVEVHGRRHPLHLPVQQLRRVGPRVQWSSEQPGGRE